MTTEVWDQHNSQLNAWLIPAQRQAEQAPVEMVPVGSLLVADSPRISGESLEHIRALAATYEQLPPIIVHRPTMRVIDGMHRLRAAKLHGQEKIAVRFFSGNAEDAFVVAVTSNTAHGLPLSLIEREAAAKRIIASHSQWSDRMIASVTGLSARVIAETRKRDEKSSGEAASRIGRDGRVRPIDSSAGRQVAAKLIGDNPDLSLRQIARIAGISPETARDVRNRLRRGEDPLPKQRRNRLTREDSRPRDQRAAFAAVGRARASDEDLAVIIGRLKADPALRFTDTGRALLRLLHGHLVARQKWEQIGENVPPHCSSVVANLARDSARLWAEFAERIEQKTSDDPQAR